MRWKGGIVAFVLLAACSSSERAPTSSDAGEAAIDAGAKPIVREQYDWSCLGQVSLPPPSTPTIAINLTLLGVTAFPAVDVPVRACPDPVDATCAGGVAQTTDSAGKTTFDLPAGTSGVSGYFETNEPGELVDLHYIPLPIVASPHEHSRVQWRGNELRVVAESAGITVDLATKGQVLVQAHDCRSGAFAQYNAPNRVNPHAGGVRFTLDPMPKGVITAYVVHDPNAFVSTTATETADDDGSGAFLNVPPGIYTVTGTLAATGQRIGTQRIHVRANAMSLLILAPTP